MTALAPTESLPKCLKLSPLLDRWRFYKTLLYQVRKFGRVLCLMFFLLPRCPVPESLVDSDHGLCVVSQCTGCRVDLSPLRV